MSFPENIIKGIPRVANFIEDDYPTTQLYEFKNTDRDDGMIENSINFEDDDQSIAVLLNQKKSDGSIQFKGGYLKVKRNDLDFLKTKPMFIRAGFQYERDPIPENPYHGNLIILKDTPKRLKRNIQISICSLTHETYLRLD